MDKEIIKQLIIILKKLQSEHPEYNIALNLTIQILKQQLPQKPLEQQGDPIFGYCPNCNTPVKPTSSPKGCKTCLQALDWNK